MAYYTRITLHRPSNGHEALWIDIEDDDATVEAIKAAAEHLLANHTFCSGDSITVEDIEK